MNNADKDLNVTSDIGIDEGAQDLKIDPKMMQMLVCPLTKTQLIWDREACELVSVAARLAFPIKKSIPLLIVDEARPLSDEEIEQRRVQAGSPNQ